ncbi:MAG: hypothetical protein JW941_05565, partial [Candidatus Coatesbacteria bacterium]|nr:hypothetical protein [Candidatus Coatesbacteria bacterium]
QYNRTMYIPPLMNERAARVLISLTGDGTSGERYVISSPKGLMEKPWMAQVGEIKIKPRPSLLESPSRGNVIFVSGFYDIERQDDEEWRWTGKEALFRLERLDETGLLYLSGEVNLERLNTIPTITITIGGQERAKFSPDNDTGLFERKMIVPDADFGESHWLDVKMETSEAFTPSKLVKSTDDRELGIKLLKIYFGPAAE